MGSVDLCQSVGTVPAMDALERRYTPEEAAELLGCSACTLRGWARRGDVPHHRIGRVKGLYFTGDDIHEIWAAQARPALGKAGAGPATGPRPAVPPAEVPAEFAVLRRGRRA